MKESSTSGALFPAWAMTRLWAICAGLQLLPYPNAQYLFSDVRLYNWWAGNIIDGHFPINDPMWQYPPIAALLFTLGYLISPQTIGFVSLALTADAAILAMLIRAGRRVTPIAVTPAWLWVATPLVMGPIALGRFDVFPTALAVAALLATRPQTTGAALAVGALLKVWPGLGLLAVKRSAFAKTFLMFILTGVAVTAALMAWWPDSFGFIIGQRSRGLQIESVGALPYMLWNVGPS
ncbi:MAG: DUF2029 domain-containing protein, partial [Actinobacteria bacterium]|nr:DUF2029 domain-containing protein [Actinomycetota bacterium]